MSIELLWKKAVAAQNAGFHSKALKYCHDILDRNARHSNAIHLLAALYLEKKQPEKALKFLDQYIELDPASPDAYSNRGNALHALGRFGESIAAHRTTIRMNPSNAVAHYNLANSLCQINDINSAVEAYRLAIQLDPTLPQPYSNLASILSELGLYQEAEEKALHAIKLCPEYVDAHYNLANAIREQGHYSRAIKAYLQVLSLSPNHCDALCNLGLTLFTVSLEEAAKTLSHTITINPAHSLARFYLGVALEESGNIDQAAEVFSKLDNTDTVDRERLSSWEYVRKNRTENTRILSDTFSALSYAFNISPNEGLICEFGVRHGTSIRFIAGMTTRKIYGFDSFLGLPEAWGDEPIGVYSTNAVVPELPKNVDIHVGSFEKTLPPFLDRFTETIAFANIDCDLYSSTKTILNLLAPRIKSGTILVFDEYLINPTWQSDEYKAFQEARKKYNWVADYVGFCMVGKQAVIRIR